MFGRKTRAEKLKKEARNRSLISGVSLAGALSGVRPIAERLLYDDDLRDNIRTLIDAAREIVDEVSDESPADIVTKLWDDPKLRSEVEAVAEAVQEGSKRIQGQRVRSGGRFRKLLLILLLAGGAFLFLSPKTGPEARRIAKDIFGALRSGS
ncbi:MAG: hypothetical protein QOI57_2196 [Rubrobacteraceae bacterium]|nr:hypothetical protein [Rubrobacteraceae bacterium]